MSTLLPKYEGKIDLIYADPPFFTNRRYPVRIVEFAIRRNSGGRGRHRGGDGERAGGGHPTVASTFPRGGFRRGVGA